MGKLLGVYNDLSLYWSLFFSYPRYVSTVGRKAGRFGVQRRKNTWQCGCVDELCNGDSRMVSVTFILLLPATYYMMNV